MDEIKAIGEDNKKESPGKEKETFEEHRAYGLLNFIHKEIIYIYTHIVPLISICSLLLLLFCFESTSFLRKQKEKS